MMIVLSYKPPIRTLQYAMLKRFHTTAGEILKDFQTIPLSRTQPFDSGRLISHIASMDNSDPQSLVFIYHKNTLRHLPQQPPALIITDRSMADHLAQLYQQPTGLNIATTNNPRLAMALIRTALDDYQVADEEWPMLHPNAQIHTSAVLGEQVRVGAGVVIGANVAIGNGCIIKSNAVIDHDVVLGANCIIHAGVNIGYGCVLGNSVTIKANTVIGTEGFGFVKDEQNYYHRIPHTGRVIIEEDVVIGSLCNIDRGTIKDTVIRTGTRIDTLVHIGHNVTIGENVLVVAQTGIAGSASIGKQSILSGQTGVLDHKTVGDNVVLVHRAAVIKDILKPGVYGGVLGHPFRQYWKSINLKCKIDKLEKRLEKLESK